MSLTVLEMLYIVLIIFSSIIGTLIIITLIRIIKILGPVVEIANFYNKIKGLLEAYATIPEKIKEKLIKKFKNEEETEVYEEKKKNTY